MNIIIIHDSITNEWRAYEHGNDNNQAWGTSREIAVERLLERQNSSSEKVVKDLKQYLKETKERINELEGFIDGDILVTEHIKARISWEELVRTKQTLEKILGFPNAH